MTMLIIDGYSFINTGRVHIHRTYSSKESLSRHSHIVHTCYIIFTLFYNVSKVQCSITPHSLLSRWMFLYKHRPGTYTQNIFKQEAIKQTFTHSSYMLHYFYNVSKIQCSITPHSLHSR